jgi:hypothetical protein
MGPEMDFLRSLPRDFKDNLGKQRKYTGSRMLDQARESVCPEIEVPFGQAANIILKVVRHIVVVIALVTESPQKPSDALLCLESVARRVMGPEMDFLRSLPRDFKDNLPREDRGAQTRSGQIHRRGR